MPQEMNLSMIHSFISISQAFSPAKVIFAGVGVLLLVRILRWTFVLAIVIPSQAAMDVRASQDTLIDIFERMEIFFQRLEIYTRVSPPPEMIDIIVKILVEVLSILGIATKEIKQGRTSRQFLYNWVADSLLIKKFVRKIPEEVDWKY
jgi:hypothetical protein